MLRSQRIAINERYRLKYERALYKAVLRLLKKEISSFTYRIKNQGIELTRAWLATSNSFEVNLGEILIKLYVAAGTAKADQVLNRLIKEATRSKRFGYNQEWVTQITDYFNNNLYSLIVRPISDNTKKLFSEKMDEMIREGHSIEWLVQQVSGPSFEAYRARMIARTESNRAINFGAYIGANNSGIETVKEWVSVHDPRTRHSHLLLDGKTVDIDQPFKPLLMYPGDPKAPGSETINCRCHVEYKPKKDANGLLIPRGELPKLTAGQRADIQRLLRQIGRKPPVQITKPFQSVAKPLPVRKPKPKPEPKPDPIPENVNGPLPENISREDLINEISKHFSIVSSRIKEFDLDTLRGIEWALRERNSKLKYTTISYRGIGTESEAVMSAQLFTDKTIQLNLYENARFENIARMLENQKSDWEKNWLSIFPYLNKLPDSKEKVVILAKAITEHEIGHLDHFLLKVVKADFFDSKRKELRKQLYKWEDKWEAYCRGKLRESNSNSLKWYPSEYSIYKQEPKFFIAEWLAEGVVMKKYRPQDIKDNTFLTLLNEFEELIKKL